MMARSPALLLPCRELDTASAINGLDGARAQGTVTSPSPLLIHTVKNQRSILALAVSSSNIYAGTQGGELLTWSLETYELLHTVAAHRGSILCLFLSQDGRLLFSSAGDAIVNVWCTKTLDRLYSIYSTYDVGDVFCIAYSSALQTTYLGAQNTSIQWYDLSQRDNRPPPNLAFHPAQRSHRFFDSKGPGGVSTPRPAPPGEPRVFGGQELEIDEEHIWQYAHYGYVYCMLLARGLNANEADEETLISGGGDGTIKLWRLDRSASGAIEDPVSLENGDDSILALALDGTFLYSGRLEGDINVWDLDTRQLIRRVKAHTVDVLTVAVGHGLLFSGGANGYVKKFNQRYECISRWKAHDELILASAVASHNGKDILVTGGNDDCVAIWDIGDCIKQPSKLPRTSNEQLIDSLAKLVSYRTVSSKPEYAEDCRRGASCLRSLFKRFGATTEMLNTEDNMNPIVFARFNGKPTQEKPGKKILFYGHYDVIAAENEQQKWIVDPFNMQGINGYLYGRGVSDNKGPVLAALYAVADLVAEQKLVSDVVFIIEGEEECGSRGFERAIKKNKHVIGDIDWILLANSYWLNDDYPCLTYGLRGVVHATVQVESDRPDLHSGVDGSHLMDEAVKDLVMLLATLSGPNGRVKIPGFYTPVLPVTEAENERYDAISKILLQRNPELGDAETLTASLKARWREPSLTIHRFKTSGPANSTIIPHVASAVLSMRIVPDQETAKIQQAMTTYLELQFQKLHSSNKLTVKIDHQAEPWLGDPENQIFQTLEEAILQVWGPIGHGRRGSVPTSKVSNSLPSPTKTSANGLTSAKHVHATSSTLTNGSDHASQATADTANSIARCQSEDNSSKTTQKPLYIREGGSIPAIRFLEKEFNAPAAHLPCGQASDCAHLDNERLRLSNLYRSREIFKKVFSELPLK
ncbi:WD40/YVTN repeat-like-containing domain [Lasallia pustulata]|uniref:WD40/YVTN repeat-like-containing domain n=1 Tax=Lasallia pustulata TaxID=136370 RepID=A0A1W5D9X9_9LECA|nr:WD40/YVTN repeat-like-containing domain [Lasallia pustulata]